MAHVRPFRALRYNTTNPLALAMVTAPPYDCITAAQRDDLFRLHPHNIVRLILARDQPGDDDRANKYTRAADLLAKWQAAKVLVRDAEPVLYFYQQEFEVEGGRYVREGVLARVGLEEFGSGKVFPHEETMDGPRADRLKLLRATRANLSPVFALYPDPRNRVPRLFHEVLQCEPLLQTVDSDGVVHRLFASSDAGLAQRVARVMAGKPLYIADGHHRYEVALQYRRELAARGQPAGPDDPGGSLLALCVSMHHPGLAVLPTHRVLDGLAGLATDRLRRATEEYFAWQDLAGAEATSLRVVERLRAAKAHSFGLWTRDTSQAFLLTLRSPRAMDRLAADRSKAWRRLDVAILDRIFLHHCLPEAAENHANLSLRYVYLAQQAFDAVHENGAAAALVLRPLPVDSLRAVAAAGERMPAKSTYFYPKALSGLVINPLD